MKRTPADDAFSRCIRERSNWTCEICGKVYPDAQATGRTKALHNSHLYGRGNWSVRFDIYNSSCMCYGCHSRYGSDKEMQEKHFFKTYTQHDLDLLTERKNDSKLGRLARKSQKEITKHYKSEYERMRKLRSEGHNGRLEFENWNWI